VGERVIRPVRSYNYIFKRIVQCNTNSLSCEGYWFSMTKFHKHAASKTDNSYLLNVHVQLPFHCRVYLILPLCYWRTDLIESFIAHNEL